MDRNKTTSRPHDWRQHRCGRRSAVSPTAAVVSKGPPLRPTVGIDQSNRSVRGFWLLLTLSVIFLWCQTTAATASDGTSAPAPTIVVLTDGSPLRGREIKGKNGKLVSEFVGVPFAEPPVGPLRFRKPVPKRPWRQTRNATRLPNACIQTPDTVFKGFSGAEMWNPNTATDEDCLYLNVWVPGRVRADRRLSVMVWIYGGGFWSGSASLDVYDGKILASEENVVIVSMNYRVSIFGFLYLKGRRDAPGNAGLWDQLLALKWVRQNVAVFGGDPDDVTIFGESAGSASVSMHLLSAHSAPYFKRAIMQSGSALARWAMERQDILERRAVHMCQAMKCGNMTIKDHSSTWNRDVIMKCLHSTDAKTLRENEWAPIFGEFADFPWVPVVDGDFFTETPSTALEKGHFKKSQILVGSNHDEAIYFIIYSLQNVFDKTTFFTRSDFLTSDQMFASSVTSLLPKTYAMQPVVRQAILQEYSDWRLPTSAVRRQAQLDDLFGDLLFVCPLNEFARRYAAHGGTVYYYYFAHRASQQTWPAWMGVVHGYEINFVFGEPLNTDDFSYTPAEQRLSRDWMRYYANFARTGNPNRNPDGTYTDDVWPMYTEREQQYLTLTPGDSYSVGHGPRRRQCAFWRTYIPKLHKATANTSDIVSLWKQEFERWRTDYIVDWQHQFEAYKRHQTLHRTDDTDDQSCPPR